MKLPKYVTYIVGLRCSTHRLCFKSGFEVLVSSSACANTFYVFSTCTLVTIQKNFTRGGSVSLFFSLIQLLSRCHQPKTLSSSIYFKNSVTTSSAFSFLSSVVPSSLNRDISVFPPICPQFYFSNCSFKPFFPLPQCLSNVFKLKIHPVYCLTLFLQLHSEFLLPFFL